MHLSDLARYGLWLGVAATAGANRRRYGMATTWAPHLLMNSVALLLPDVCRALLPDGRGAGDLLRAGIGALAGTVRDNPGYVWYIAPFTAGYLASHPEFDIYKGEMGDLRLAGFGLDAIPHGVTALAVTLLAGDLLEAAAASAPRGRIQEVLAAGAAHRPLVTGMALALLTAGWELMEYLTHRHELALQGDPARINMVWSPEDTLRDCAANALGWAVATMVSR